MIRRPSAFAVLLGCCLACPAAESPPASTTTAAKPTPNPETKQPATPTPPVAEPKPPALEPQPLPAIELLAAPQECPPLAELAADAPESQRKLVPLAVALRSVACAPEVFGQPLATARETLEIPKSMPLKLGRRYARFELGDEPVLVGDLLAALGVSDAKMHLQQGMMPVWIVEITTWGPGHVRIPIAADRHEAQPNGTVVEIAADANIAGAVSVTMPPESLRFADDPHAGALLAAALSKLAEQPDLLGKDPEQVHAELATLGERFELYRYSEGSGEEQRVGFSIRPLRTELVAADFATALGLDAAAHETRQIYDANPNRLVNDGETPFTWKGLQLDVELDPRDQGLGLGRWLIDDIQVLPGSPD